MSKNEIPKGTTDYYGKEAQLRDYVLSIIEKTYKKYGFESLYTPIIENAEVFNGHHGEGEKLLFKFNDKENNNLVLKYDATVPLARVISMHKDIALPYKRYQLQPSFRDDEIDKGHYREFIQCDGDVIGSKSLYTDAEFICISYDVLSNLGFDDFTIRLNHRKIIQAIAEKENMSSKEEILGIQRAIDFADKINKGSIAEIKKEMNKTNLNSKIINDIIEMMEITRKSLTLLETLDNLKEYFANNETAEKGIKELKKIVSLLPDYILDKIKIDFTLARGADYYTGFIIEAVINNVNVGAVLGGGRYDNLLQSFSNENIPAVGIAFGMERIIVSMKEKGIDNICLEDNNKLLLYVKPNQDKIAVKISNELRKKYNVCVVFENEIEDNKLRDYCLNKGFYKIATIDENNMYQLHTIDEKMQNEQKCVQ